MLEWHEGGYEHDLSTRLNALMDPGRRDSNGHKLPCHESTKRIFIIKIEGIAECSQKPSGSTQGLRVRANIEKRLHMNCGGVLSAVSHCRKLAKHLIINQTTLLTKYIYVRFTAA